jgi:hypothetical protein
MTSSNGLRRHKRSLKKYLTTPPTWVALEPHKNLQQYISTISNVVSTCIVVERRESDTNRKIQYPVYLVSEVLSDSNSVFSYHEARLRITDYVSQAIPLFSGAPDIGSHIIDSGRNIKWAIKLSMYDIVYKPRTAIKAQDLSDFVVEWTETQTPPKERELEYWTINFNGSLQL